MDIWIKGTRRIRIPVLPSSYSISSQENDTVVNVIGLGEVVLRGQRSLQEVSFSSFFPRRYDASYCQTSSLRSPREYCDIIESMKRSGPVKLTISGILNGRYRITEFTHGEPDGTGDIEYTLTLREYRAPSAQQSSVVAASSVEVSGEKPITDTLADSTDATEGGETRTTKMVASAKQYVVKAGDCVSSIARRLYGDNNWQQLYEKNKDVIGSNPVELTEGTYLTP